MAHTNHPSIARINTSDPIVTVSVETDLDAVSSIWRDLQSFGVSSPYQCHAWYAAWTRMVSPLCGETPLIITAFDNVGQATLLLPLVLRSRFSARVASFPGGKHANFKMPLFRRDVTFTTDALERLFAEVVRIRPDIDLFVFDALPASWNGTANPLVTVNACRHPAAASVLPLVLNPQQLFDRTLTADRRRKLRANDRKLSQSGVAFRRAVSPTEIRQALAAFLAHKAPWFLARGLANPFQQPGVMAFFAHLAMGPESGLEIHCLHAENGAIVAVAATIVGPDRASLMFVSYDATSPVAAHSPGTKLVREIIADVCGRGLAVFDFGLGEAAYKASFGAQPEPTYVALRPHSLRGRLAAALIEGQRRTKAVLKTHPNLLTKLLRWKRLFPPSRHVGVPGGGRPAKKCDLLA